MSFRVNGTTIYLTRGDTFRAVITISNPDGSIYTPQEGDKVRFAMKEDIESEELLIFREVPIDTMELVLYPGDTKGLEYGSYVYDIQLTRADGMITTIVPASRFRLTEEVTY